MTRRKSSLISAFFETFIDLFNPDNHSLSAILEVTKQECGPGGCALALYSQGWRSKIQRQREQLVTNKRLRMPVIGKGPDLDFISPPDL